jgi:transcriptional regulator with XRE-family HTH domain
MEIATHFGSRVKELREKHNLLQRHVASLLDIDTPLFSKIERGERTAKKEIVSRLAGILKADKEELLTLWLADQVVEVVKNEDYALKAMQVAEAGVKYKKTKK